jgi:hypothetical protein
MTISLSVLAFLDANILYPAFLRNVFMYLALRGLYRARWSARVHDEWSTSVLAKRTDLTRAALERTRSLMDAHIQDALVQGYEGLEATLHLPDPDDRHILAAAIHCGATAIITFNLRDFPEDALAPFGIRATHPDEFIRELFGVDQDAVLSAFRELRADYRNPPRTSGELLAMMEKQGLARSAEALKPFQDLL